MFAVPTRRHMNYQCTEVLPYWIKSTVLRKKGLVSPQLYKFDNVYDISDSGSNRIEKV